MYSDLEIKAIYAINRFSDNQRLVAVMERLLDHIDCQKFRDHQNYLTVLWRETPYWKDWEPPSGTWSEMSQ